MPAQTNYEIPGSWGHSPFEELTLPSGYKILAKRLEFEDIIAAGLIDEFDVLTPVVEEKVVGPAKGKKPADRQPKKLTKAQAAKKDQEDGLAMFRDKDSSAALLRVLALMLPQVVAQPTIYASMEQVDGEWRKISPTDRIEGRVYVDSIPLPDQMHIFGWAMKGMDTEKLSTFREQPEPDLGAVESSEESAVPTQSAARG